MVSNAAESGATGGTVKVTETLPAGLTISSMAGIGWSCSTETTYSCTRSDRLSAGSTYPPITVAVNVLPTAPAMVTNAVSVAGGGSAVAVTAVDHATVLDPSLCDINADGVINVVDIQLESNEVLKLTPQTNDLNQDGKFDVSDVQIEVTAALGLGCSAVAKLAITSTTLPAGTVGLAYGQTVAASGGTAPYNWSGTTGLPAGLSISSSGTITGTPTAAGTSTVDLKVTDSGTPAQTATANLSLTIVSQGGPLSITTSSLPNGVGESSYSLQLSAAGGVQPYSWTAAPLPAGLTLNSSTGLISGTPTTAGGTNVTITVTDSSTPTKKQANTTLSLTIIAPGGPAITVTSVTVGQNLQLPITITFNPALPSNATLTVTSSDPNQVLLGSSGILGSGSLSSTVDQGTTSVVTWVQASGSVGSVISITAAVGGYTDGFGTVTIANSGFFVEGPDSGIGAGISTYLGVTTTLTVYSARLNSSGQWADYEELRAGYSVNIPISSSDTSVGTVSTPVAFSGGAPSATTNFVAGSTTTGSTTVTVGPLSPFATPALGGSILITVLPSGLTAFTATIGNNLQTNVHVTRSGDLTSIAQVTITSPDPSLLVFSTTPTGNVSGTSNTAPPTASITVTIPAGQTITPDFYAHAYGSSGTVSCNVSAPGYGTATATVTLAPSGLVIVSPFGTDANFSTTVQTTADLIINTASLDGSGNPLALQAVAYNVSISASVAPTNSNLGTVSGSPVTIATSFGTDSTTFVTFTTLQQLGTTAITATASGYQSASVNVTVNQQALLVSDDGGQAVGQNLEATGKVIVPGAAPSSPIQISVQSSSPNLLLSTDNATWKLNITVTVAANTTSTTFYIESLASSGQGTITASTTADFGSGSDTISMVPSGILIYSTNTGNSLSISLGSGLTAPFTVFAGQLDSSDNFVVAQNVASTLTVNFGNTNPAVGTFPSSLTIPVGTKTNTSGVFTPKATGSTTISVTEPSGFATPTAPATVTSSVAVTVNP
jgi:hypothetical protein